MIIMTMMGLTPGPLVRTLLAIFLRFDNAVGCANVLGYGVFVPTGFYSTYNIVCLPSPYQYASNSKVVNSLKNFGAQIAFFISKF